ncbi:MAG: sugar phosphate isomerase/epimerase family protein [Spirochaetota bacterium]
MAGNEANGIKVASMSLIWGLREPGEIDLWLEETARAGYDGVTGFVDDFAPFFDRPSELAERLSRHGLELAAVDSGLHADEEAYRRVFALMRELGCTIFVCIDRNVTKKDYAYYGRLLNEAGKIASEYGIAVHYHNHTAAVGETLTDMERLMEQTDPSLVRLMLDVGHATKDFVELAPAERAITFLERYWDRIHYLELKDWNGATDLNTPLGEGHADFDRIFALMQSGGYSGWLTVEQNGNDGASLGRSPFECALTSRRFIRDRLGV